ncbi:hypothetical protein BDV97DRAFT_138252 [Delphinella strobiligena]|nr:hypothetical protein BDV97DRAFT_138252 [Delphinella strobiligena]
MVADIHMHDTSHPHTVRDTIEKRKRISDHHLSSSQIPATQSRQHARKSSLDNRTFSINTRRSLDFVRPTDLETRCYDWVIQKRGVHYARNKSWFAQYTAVNIQLNNGLWCQGYGTVRLDVRKSEEEGFQTLVLHDVLHLPKAVCNGFSLALFGHLQPTPQGLADPNSASTLLVKNFRGLSKLALLGHLVGESPLEEMVEDDMPGNLLDLSVSLNQVDVQKIKDIVSQESK